MRHIAVAVAVLILAARPVAAADSSPSDKSREKQREAADLAIEATQKFMRAIELMIQALPQYGPPQIDDQGNIIIPRLPNAEPKALPQPPNNDDDEEDAPPANSGGTSL